jgi:uncharacterized membrane protein
MGGESIITYPPLPYLTNALVIKIGEFLNFSALVVIYVCRIINLLIYTTITYFAIKKIPILKHALLLIALMPGTLFLAGSASNDSLTMVLSFLVIALFLELSLNEVNIRTNDIYIYIYILFITTLALSLTKPTYALITLLFFIIPHNKFKNTTNYLKTFFCTCLIPIAISIIWINTFKHLYSFLNQGYNSFLKVNVYSISFLYHHPIKFINFIINTIIGSKGQLYIIEFVTGDYRYELTLPIIVVVFVYFILLLTSVYDISDFRINLKQKLIGLSIFLIVFLAMCMAEFITWTPLGSNTIWGLQGRYFTPIGPLLLLIFNNPIKNTSSKKFYKKLHFCVFLWIIFFLSLSVYILIF